MGKLSDSREYIFMFSVIQISSFLSKYKNTSVTILFRIFPAIKKIRTVHTCEMLQSHEEKFLAGFPGQDQELLEIFSDSSGNFMRTDCMALCFQ